MINLRLGSTINCDNNKFALIGDQNVDSITIIIVRGTHLIKNNWSVKCRNRRLCVCFRLLFFFLVKMFGDVTNVYSTDS